MTSLNCVHLGRKSVSYGERREVVMSYFEYAVGKVLLPVLKSAGASAVGLGGDVSGGLRGGMC